MASLVDVRRLPTNVRLLDPGAGVGSLTAAVVNRLVAEDAPPRILNVAAYEINPRMLEDLDATLAECAVVAEAAGLRTSFQAHPHDFVQAAFAVLDPDLFATDPAMGERRSEAGYDLVVMNPPTARSTPCPANAGCWHELVSRSATSTRHSCRSPSDSSDPVAN